MADLGRKVMWTVVGGATAKAVRKATRNALHDEVGKPKLPRPVRRRRGLAPALAFAVGAAALNALADVLWEQARDSASAR
jgi:hypothetical protein